MNELDRILLEVKKEKKQVPVNKKYECSICQDSTWVEKNEDGHSYVIRCECFAVKEARKRIECSKISQEFQSKGFKNFDTRDVPQLVHAKNKAIAYYQNFLKIEHNRGNSILFCGQVGSGKTHLGTAICSNLMNQNIAVIYMSYRNTVTGIKQRLTDKLDYEQELSKYAKARVLYIDDLLKGKTTESDVNIMYEIVNYRYMNNLPLIISTEKSLEELLVFDEAIGSRIIEMCQGNIVVLQGRELNYRLSS